MEPQPNDPTTTAKDAEPAAIPTPDPELARLRGERDQLQDQLLRAMADLQNIRRRQQKEIEDSRRRVLEGLAQELLPVLDHFGAALQVFDQPASSADPKTLLEGVRMVRMLLAAALERHGLAEIPAQDLPFDPARHEAVAVEARPGIAAGVVLKVLQTGYLLGDRVLRHAKVLVAAEPEKS